MPADEEIEKGEIEEEELEMLEEQVEMDYQIGEDLKEKVRHFCTAAQSWMWQLMPFKLCYISDRSPCH